MSSVLVLIIIPEKDYEEEVREKEELQFKLTNRKKRESIRPTTDDKEQRYPLEKVAEDALSYLGIVDASWQKSQNGKYFTITFPVDLEDSDIVIQYFKSLGIGARFDTSVGLIPFSYFLYNEDVDEYDDLITENGEKDINKSVGNFKEKQNKFFQSVTARVTVAQVVTNVRGNATITFDFACYVIFASWVAAMGLLDNSVISLVASMLISPMMGPLMAITFGTTVRDFSLVKLGIRNILIVFSMAISFGFIFGLICLNFTDGWTPGGPWPTDMMRERGQIRGTWDGTLVALPSGAAVAIGLLQGSESTLVGVAISVSLLPPNVNAGLLWAFSVLKCIWSLREGEGIYVSQLTGENITMNRAFMPEEPFRVTYNDNMAIECIILGFVSILFSVVNIVNIFIGATLLLKIKEVAPLSTLSPENRRFFHEDVKIARQYNAKNANQTRVSDLGEEVLKEWATVAGLDKGEFLRPESRAIQQQTLEDIARDVESDLVFQSVAKINKNNENLARRMSQGIFLAGGINHLNRLDLDDSRRNSHRSSLRSGSSNSTNPPQSPQVVTSDVDTVPRRPSTFGGRRRISAVAINNYQREQESSSNGRSPPPKSGGVSNLAFSFNESDINGANNSHQQMYERNRKQSSALLRHTLQNSEHSPYSMWPSTRQASMVAGMDRKSSKFTVTPVNDRSGKMSVVNMTKFD